MPQELTIEGGSYDWDMMPLVPEAIALSQEQRTALGKLTSDMGISCGMNYTAEYSGAGAYMIAHALTNVFGYANATAVQYGTDLTSFPQLRRAILSNLDAKLPVVLSIKKTGATIIGPEIGHAVIADGYGYHSGNTLYLHFNMGWSGSCDVWYAPPAMTADGQEFNQLNGFVYNIYTNNVPDGVICSGRILTSNGAPVANAKVVARLASAATSTAPAYTSTSDANGIYALIVPPGTYNVTATFRTRSSSIQSLEIQPSVGTKILTDSNYFGQYQNGPESFGNQTDRDIVMPDMLSVAAPVMYPSASSFYPYQNVTIACPTEDAVIHYTLDGTPPTEKSPIYKGPITLEDSATVTARAWHWDLLPSEIVSVIYTYDLSRDPLKGDNFSNPFVIHGANNSRAVTGLYRFTKELNEPDHIKGISEFHTAWFKWTAPASGTMRLTSRFEAEPSSTIIAVYTGDSYESLKRIVVTDVPLEGSYPETVRFHFKKGITYRFVVMIWYEGDPDSGEDDTLTLFWEPEGELFEPGFWFKIY